MSMAAVTLGKAMYIVTEGDRLWLQSVQHKTSLASVSGPWSIHFQTARGAPKSVSWPALKSWTADATPGIKYFSGTATYRTSIKATATWGLKSGRILLDLGAVKNLAEIFVNDRSAGLLWKSPFLADITDLLHKGDNRVSVRVTNLWPNRLIGDRQPGATPVAFATYNPYSPDFPLLESGLLGPVRILKSVVAHESH